MSAVNVEHSDQEVYRMSEEAPVVVPGLTMTGHLITVPLDYSSPDAAHIDVYFRVVNDIQRANSASLPWLVFLQGSEAPRPTESSGWLSKAVQYFNVILLDQRGTGRSTPVTAITIRAQGSAESQANYLQHFRANNIVLDCEAIRRTLLGDTRWSLLGQSFGGFCCLHYLSTAPDALSEVFMTGGIPPGITLKCSADVAYEHLFKRVITQNNKYYSRFPQDAEIVRRLVLHLHSQPEGGVRLPRGSLLTPRGVQLLGLTGLGSGGGFERLHFLLERTFDGENISLNFLLGYEAWMPWGSNPLYAILHESIYCQQGASMWAAQRIRDRYYSTTFDAVEVAQAGLRVPFTGEMVFPWMFEDFLELQPFREAAEILAVKKDWCSLYSGTVLGSNDVPVAAACYFEDMYVDFDLTMDTASDIRGLRTWVTNEYMHSGIREDGPRILDRLMGMTRNSRPLT